MSITHIPGKVVQIGPRKIQRCGVCGEKLVDNLLFLQGRVAVESTIGVVQDGPGFWEVGDPIRQDGNYWSVIGHQDGQPLPDDCCVKLVGE